MWEVLGMMLKLFVLLGIDLTALFQGPFSTVMAVWTGSAPVGGGF